jgi:hypothetical protein
LDPNEEQATLDLLTERQAKTFENTSPRPINADTLQATAKLSGRTG